MTTLMTKEWQEDGCGRGVVSSDFSPLPPSVTPGCSNASSGTRVPFQTLGKSPCVRAARGAPFCNGSGKI